MKNLFSETERRLVFFAGPETPSVSPESAREYNFRSPENITLPAFLLQANEKFQAWAKEERLPAGSVPILRANGNLDEDELNGRAEVTVNNIGAAKKNWVIERHREGKTVGQEFFANRFGDEYRYLSERALREIFEGEFKAIKREMLVDKQEGELTRLARSVAPSSLKDRVHVVRGVETRLENGKEADERVYRIYLNDKPGQLSVAPGTAPGKFLVKYPIKLKNGETAKDTEAELRLILQHAEDIEEEQKNQKDSRQSLREKVDESN
ncbi:hypothetical protein A3A67_00445 [Candidatus Peribacteria bacterium RIFCSPLOWO2_01_FULL_51_18]|nr:MAG: hypothetical protein A3C52_01245 [Candidatus Peribacteria bacterium RIFCSPHIGHO2_02_FULL_51_15]OGJ66646.1 MAG: hypothetical protein A3A67_00445 [Candidatus Peribacteria bacterium RIFCSPLOWO2_01_FULL_51_18]OGJ69431.1 MAG: hypothetical protein A3J34_05290 [Candidatus Peribacteria bacterium RIFCSPLOWO2_02_FULL_51_10]